MSYVCIADIRIRIFPFKVSAMVIVSMAVQKFYSLHTNAHDTNN